MPFKQMPPDLTDFNNWFDRFSLGRGVVPAPEIKNALREAWNESGRLHAEYLSGELARIEAERQSE